MRPNVEKRLYVNQIQAGQQVEDIFLVTRKSLAETRAGKPFLTLGLMDKTGAIEARVWDNAVHFAGEAELHDIVHITAAATEYKGQVQLKVLSLVKMERKQTDIVHFMPTSERPVKEMAAELDRVIKGIRDPSLQQLLKEIFQGDTRQRFLHAPAAKRMHHAYIGGLAEHTLSVAGMARKTAAHYPVIDEDMLVAGALLHDIAKIMEFDFSSPAFEYTTEGRLVGHLVLGAELVRKAAEKVPGLAPEMLDRLTHLILSHHGQLEFGSPVLPMTPEAILLHHLDDMDAKMNYMKHLSDTITDSSWQWTEYQRPLERFLYLKGSNQQKESHNKKAPSAQAQQQKKNTDKEQLKHKQQSLFSP